MSIFRQQWTCVEAVVHLFFPHSAEFGTAGKNGKPLRQFISCKFNGMSIDLKDLPHREKTRATEAVEAIQKAIPSFRHDSKLHAMLWVRWAFNTKELQLAPDLIKNLCIWVAKQSTGTPLLFQYKQPDTDKTPKTKIWRGLSRKNARVGQPIGYTLEEIIKLKKLPVGKRTADKSPRNAPAPDASASLTPEASEYTLLWRIRKVSARGINARARTNKQVCGSQVIALLTESVKNEATSKENELLKGRKEKGKYICRVPRNELLSDLKRKFPKIEGYSDATLSRALSTIVRSRGRPGGLRPD